MLTALSSSPVPFLFLLSSDSSVADKFRSQLHLEALPFFTISEPPTFEEAAPKKSQPDLLKVTALKVLEILCFSLNLT